MKNDEFILTQGLGQQLEFAFRRNGWDAGQVHKLCEGDRLGLIRQFMLQPNEPPSDLSGTLKRNPLFVPWKTITIGRRKSVDDLLQALKQEAYPVWPSAEAILRHPDVILATEETRVNLALLNGRDLGLDEHLHYSIMRRRMIRMGFKLCTPEMAAELRLVWDDQEEIRTVVAMEPIDGDVLDMNLDNDKGELELASSHVNELAGYSADCLQYICVIP